MSILQQWLQRENLYLRRRDLLPFERIPGFVRGRHFVPERLHPAALAFAMDLLEADLKKEVQEIHQQAKRILGLRHSGIKKHYAQGSATVECPQFFFTLETSQREENPKELELVRKLKVFSDLPAGFDEIFPLPPDEIVISLDEGLGFGLLMESLEELVEKKGGVLSDDEEEGWAEYASRDGNLFLKVDLKRNEAVIRSRFLLGFLALLQAAKQDFLP